MSGQEIKRLELISQVLAGCVPLPVAVGRRKWVTIGASDGGSDLPLFMARLRASGAAA